MQTHYGLPLNFPEEASAHAAQLDDLTALVHWLMIALFVGWGLFFIYALIRFRKGRNPQASYAGAKAHFSTYGEAGIALIEVILLVVFAVPIWAKRVSAIPPESQATVVRIVAEQFAWNIHYPGKDGVFGRTDPKLIAQGTNPLGLDPTDPAGKDDIVMLNELHMPVGKPVIIKLSTKDVIHSLNLPQMRVKQDAIPGQVIPIWFQPIKTGQWDIACAQLCGLSHYRMRGSYTVESQADFDKWSNDNAPKTAAISPPPASVPVPPGTAPATAPVTAPPATK
jgi:cytochrome c oxidase subunit 2